MVCGGVYVPDSRSIDSSNDARERVSKESRTAVGDDGFVMSVAVVLLTTQRVRALP